MSHLWHWLHKNLFSNTWNTLLTLLVFSLLSSTLPNFLLWVFHLANWQVITANLKLFLLGYYPEPLLWRVYLSLIFIFILTVTTHLKPKFICPYLSLIWFFSFFIILSILQGGILLEYVSYSQFSGLLLTILVALISIFLSFPLGIILALGRRSNLPIIRTLAIAYIETVRGLPLIGILFIAQVLLPLILPPHIRLDSIIRAIAGFTLFSSAYLAENLRGGLQAIPPGQTEAAKALGLNPFLTLALIILPQALRAVIPSIVGQFISLFKDTSLLAIVGLVDLLGISQSILANPKYQGRHLEVFLFLGFLYWLFCSLMAWGSRQLESRN